PSKTMNRPLRFLAIILSVNIATFTGLAHATPPDPTWISGMYDDADYDDVILLATWTASTLPDSPAPTTELPPVVVDLLAGSGSVRVTDPDVRHCGPRGPPSV